MQPRTMIATFNGNPSSTIISCYSPTTASNEKDFNNFDNEIFSFVRRVTKGKVSIRGGDLGKNENIKLSLHKFSNRNGESLTDF